MERGRFITLEGGDGAGKSTQADRIAGSLRDAGMTVLQTREPGGAPGAERLRTLLLDNASPPWSPVAETLLHYAARIEHLVHTVRPALNAGTWVVSDRFADPTLAYQGYGRELGGDFVSRLHALIAADDTPDLTLILDLPPEIGLQRALARRREQGGPGALAGAGDAYESQDIAFHRRVRQGLLEVAAAEPRRCVVIDATASVAAMAAAIADAVRRRLGIPVGAP